MIVSEIIDTITIDATGGATKEQVAMATLELRERLGMPRDKVRFNFNGRIYYVPELTIKEVLSK